MSSEVTQKNSANRILVLDDEELLGWCICYELRGLGYEVHLANNLMSGQQALNFFQPHLIICDQNFPEGDCLDMLVRWNLKSEGIETVLITAYTPPSLTELKNANVRSCLSKPFEMKVLIDLVQEQFAHLDQAPISL